MTAVLYFGEMFIAPLLAIVLLAILPLKMTSVFGLFIGGVVVWTFAEYVFHRFVFHKLMPKEHGLHHANPDEPVRPSAPGFFFSRRLKMHIRHLLLAAALLTLPVAAHADNGCAAKAAQLVKELGARIDHRDKGGIWLAHPAAVSGPVVGCAVAGNDNAPLEMSVASYDDPPDEFWRFVGNAGKILTGADAAEVGVAGRACASRLKEGRDTGLVPIDKGDISCVRAAPAGGFLLSVIAH
jgi:hypothetical protein